MRKVIYPFGAMREANGAHGVMCENAAMPEPSMQDQFVSALVSNFLELTIPPGEGGRALHTILLQNMNELMRTWNSDRGEMGLLHQYNAHLIDEVVKALCRELGIEAKADHSFSKVPLKLRPLIKAIRSKVDDDVLEQLALEREAQRPEDYVFVDEGEPVVDTPEDLASETVEQGRSFEDVIDKIALSELDLETKIALSELDSETKKALLDLHKRMRPKLENAIEAQSKSQLEENDPVLGLLLCKHIDADQARKMEEILIVNDYSGHNIPKGFKARVVGMSSSKHYPFMTIIVDTDIDVAMARIHDARDFEVTIWKEGSNGSSTDVSEEIDEEMVGIDPNLAAKTP